MTLTPLIEVYTSAEAGLSFEEREGPAGKKQLWLETIVQRADARNRNGRIYPRSVLEREVTRFNDHIKQGTSYGEADHPKPGETPSVTRQAILWKSVKMDEAGVVKGQGIVLDTAAGKDVKAILSAGGAIGTSSRGRGTVSLKTVEGRGQQAEVVNEDYSLRTFDLVIDQSVHDAVSRLTRYEQHLIEQELRETPTKDQENPMDLETLKKEHPAAYEAMIKEAKDSLKESNKVTLDALLKEKETELRTSILGEMQESGQLLDEDGQERVTNLEAFLTVVMEAAKETNLLDPALVAENAVQEEVTKLRETNKTQAARIAALEKALEKVEAKTAKADVKEAAETFAKDHALSAELSEALAGECENLEVFESKKDAIKARYDTLAERLADSEPKGKGRTHLTEDGDDKKIEESKKDDDSKDLSENQSRLRSLAGI